MSASSKKKLRKEQEAVKLTEKQLAAQKEAKKTNLYTAIFVAALAIILVVAIVVGVNQTISSHGVREKNTVAMTVNGHKVSNAELNYFYMDAVNKYYQQIGSYAALVGLDPTAPLDQQVVDEETGKTWADNFLESAMNNAKAVYALADAAKAEGFTLSEDEKAALDNQVSMMNLYASVYGYSDGSAYLKALYGKGATIDSYKAYAELTSLASAYQTHYNDSLTYTDADLAEKYAENPSVYTSFSYNSYYLSASRFLEGGTTGEDGNTTYSDAEKVAAAAAAEEAAKALTSKEITDLDALNAAIAALPINADTNASSTAYTDNRYKSVVAAYRDWIADSSRKAGDLTYIASTSTGADGTETADGYYVVYFVGSNDNTFALKNVRHILVSFEGGTTDEATGQTTYSDEEKAAAKASAEEILNTWKSGEATEDSFAALAKEKSTDPGSVENGGLYENVYPGQMVPAFNDWCFDESRKPGDTGIVETNYGYHVMYFSGDAGQNYRDYLIEKDLRTADAEEWFMGLTDAASMTEGDTHYVRKDLVLSRG